MNSVHITIHYDKDLQIITEVDHESMVVSSNTNFLHVLYFIFTSYPQIPKTYTEGTLGMLLNDKPPSEYDVVQEGDVIKLTSYLEKKDIHSVN